MTPICTKWFVGGAYSALQTPIVVFRGLLLNRAALTGKHNTLVRRAPAGKGPDGQQAKKISCYKMFILHNKRFDMTS